MTVPPIFDTLGQGYAFWAGFSNGSADQATVNFGASSFVGAIPSGFTAWDVSGATTMDPSFAGAGITFSNGDLTVNRASVGGGTWSSTRSTTRKSGGKWYWEDHVDSLSGPFDQVAGISSPAVTSNFGDPPGFGGATFNAAAGWQTGQSGFLFNGGVSGPNPGTYASGDTRCYAVDLTANLFWVRNGAGGNWNGSGTADPATGVGGFSINAAFTPWVAVFFGSTGSTTVLPFNISTGSTDEIIVVDIMFTCSGATSISVASVTATGLTFANRQVIGSSSSGNSRFERWWAHAPTPDTFAVTVTMSAGPANTAIVINSYGVVGVGNPSSPWDTSSAFPANPTNGAAPVTSQNNDLLLGVLGDSVASSPGFVTGWVAEIANGLNFGGALSQNYLSTLQVTSAGGQTFSWGGFVTLTSMDAMTGDNPPPPPSFLRDPLALVEELTGGTTVPNIRTPLALGEALYDIPTSITELRASLIIFETLETAPEEGPVSTDLFPSLIGLSWSTHKKPKFNSLISPQQSGKEVRSAQYVYPIWEFNLEYDYLPDNTLGNNPDVETLLGFFLQRQGSFDSFLFQDPTDFIVGGGSQATGDGTSLQFPISRTLGGFLEPVCQLDQTLLNDFAAGAVNTGTNAIAATAHGMTTGTGPVLVTNTGGALPTGLLHVDSYWIIAVDANHYKFASSLANAMAGTPVTLSATGSGTNAVNRDIAVYDNGTLLDKTAYSILAPNQLLFAVAPAAGHAITADFQFFFVCRFLDDQQDYENFANKLWQLQKCDFMSIIQ